MTSLVARAVALALARLATLPASSPSAPASAVAPVPAAIAPTESVDGLVVERFPKRGDAPLAYFEVSSEPVGPQRCFRRPAAAPSDVLYVARARGVVSFEAATLVDDPRAPRLDVDLLALDLATLGSRRLAHRSTPLALVARGRDDVRVYGYRDPILDEVHLLVRSHGPTTLRDATLRRTPGATTASTQCAFSELVLGASDAASGGATAQLAGNTTDATPRASRPLVVTASLSRTSTDTEPLLDVTVEVGEDRASDRVLPRAEPSDSP